VARVLLINANTTSSVTGLIEQHARAAVGDTVELRAVTAEFGAPYVSTEFACAVAGDAVLDCYERHGKGCDAVLIACFGDPGLFELRKISAIPVLGMAEACMAEAASRGKFSIVTGGPAWKPMLERLALLLGFSSSLVNVNALPLAGPDLAKHEELIEKAITQEKTNSVIIGGAALAGIAARLQPKFDVPLIDSVECAARAAARLALA